MEERLKNPQTILVPAAARTLATASFLPKTESAVAAMCELDSPASASWSAWVPCSRRPRAPLQPEHPLQLAGSICWLVAWMKLVCPWETTT